MTTAPESQTTAPLNPTPLQQNAQGILVGAPPPLATQSPTQSAVHTGGIGPNYLLALGNIQLILSGIFVFVGIPLMNMAHLTLQTTNSHITPYQLAFLNAIIGLIVLGGGLAGKKFRSVAQHWLFPKAAWILYGVGVLAIFVLTVYIAWLLLFP